MTARINGAAADNLDLLHEIDRAPEGATKTSIATAMGRDQSNFSKTYARLRDEGYVEADVVALSEAGKQLVRMVAPTGEIIADPSTLMLTFDQLTPDPDNARKSYDAAGIDDLRSDIVSRTRPGRVGLLHPLTVIPPSPLGVKWQVKGGWRRCLAIEAAIRAGQIDADAPIPCVRHEGLTPAEAAIMALVENIQREDLHRLDEGAAYASLVASFAMSEAEIAGKVKKSLKHVQDRIRLTEALSPADQARMRLPDTDQNHLSYTAARKLMQEQNARPRAAVDVTPKEALLLLEVADRVKQRPSHDSGHLGKDGWTRIDAAPAGGSASSLVGKSLLQIDDASYGAHAYVRLHPDNVRALADWIAAQLAEHMQPLWHARAQVLGSGVAASLHTSHRYATDWLNDPLPPPEPRSAPPSPPPPAEAGEGDHEVVEGTLAGAINHDPSPIALHPGNADLHAPGLPDVHDGPRDDEPPEYLRRLAGAPPAHPSDLAPPAVTAPQPDPALTPRQRQILIDVCHKSLTDPTNGRAGPDGQVAYVGALAESDFSRDAEAQPLITPHRLMAFVQPGRGHGMIAILTERGKAWAVRNGAENPADPAIGPPYATPWLNPAKAAAPEPQHPAHPGEGRDPDHQPFWAFPTVAVVSEFTCGNCEKAFEISGEMDEYGEGLSAHLIPDDRVIDTLVFTPPADLGARCPHCDEPVTLLAAEVYLVKPSPR